MKDNIVQFPKVDEAEVKKLTDEIVNEPFFSFLERVGKEFHLHEGHMRNLANGLAERAWPQGSNPPNAVFINRILDEMDERFRDISSRLQTLGMLASRSKVGIEAAVAAGMIKMPEAPKDAAAAAPAPETVQP